jgi:hypothetical protein
MCKRLIWEDFHKLSAFRSEHEAMDLVTINLRSTLAEAGLRHTVIDLDSVVAYMCEVEIDKCADVRNCRCFRLCGPQRHGGWAVLSRWASDTSMPPNLLFQL